MRNVHRRCIDYAICLSVAGYFPILVRVSLSVFTGEMVEIHYRVSCRDRRPVRDDADIANFDVRRGGYVFVYSSSG